MRLRLPKKRRWRVTLYFFSFLLILLAVDLIWVQVWRRVHVGYDTTRITAPLRPDGTVDYLAFLDNRAAAGVTAENNAAPLLRQAIGPREEPPWWQEAVSRRLSIPKLPEKGDYFVSFWTYAQEYAGTAGAPATEPAATGSNFENWSNQEETLMASQPWRAAEHPMAAAWLAANARPMELAQEACRRPHYYVPPMTNPPSAQGPPLLGVILTNLGLERRLADAFAARALQRIVEGGLAGAREDLRTTHRLARLRAQGWTLLERLVAVAIERKALRAEQALAGSDLLSPEMLRELLSDAEKLPTLPPIADAMGEGERYFLLDAITWAARSSPRQMIRSQMILRDMGAYGEENVPTVAVVGLSLLPLHYDAALREANDWCDRLVATSAAPTYRARNAGYAAWEKDLRAMRADTVGMIRAPYRIFIFDLMPSMGRAMQIQDEMIMDQGLTRLALALALCKAERGAYPEKLADLAPAYLKEIPADLFLNEPLHYARTKTGFLLYSVGPNMKDDAGIPRGKGQHGEDDIVVRVGVE